LRSYCHGHRRKIRRRSAADLELLRVLELSPGRRRTRAAVPCGCGARHPRSRGPTLDDQWAEDTCEFAVPWIATSSAPPRTRRIRPIQTLLVDRRMYALIMARKSRGCESSNVSGEEHNARCSRGSFSDLPPSVKKGMPGRHRCRLISSSTPPEPAQSTPTPATLRPERVPRGFCETSPPPATPAAGIRSCTEPATRRSTGPAIPPAASRASLPPDRPSAPRISWRSAAENPSVWMPLMRSQRSTSAHS